MHILYLSTLHFDLSFFSRFTTPPPYDMPTKKKKSKEHHVVVQLRTKAHVMDEYHCLSIFVLGCSAATDMSATTSGDADAAPL